MSKVPNYEARDIFSVGPKFRLTTNDTLMGSDGRSVYTMYAVNDDNDVNLMSFSESGTFKIYNDRGIEIIAGNKSASSKGVDIVIAGMNGDITITAMSNGSIRIKGKSVMIEAVEDLDLKAGRNLNLTTGSGRVLIDSNKFDQKTLTGNAALKTFGSRCFEKSPVGEEYIKDIFIGNIDINLF